MAAFVSCKHTPSKRTKMNYLARFFLLGLPLISPEAGAALELDIIRYNALAIITVSGEIEAGDAARFQQFWTENAYDAFSFKVAFDSPGGNLAEGIEIGRFIRTQGVDTTIQKYPARAPLQSDWDYSGVAEPLSGAGCYSACALAFMGGVNREVLEGAEIGFHQFYGGVDDLTASAVAASTQAISALIAGYLREMGGAPELFELMSVTPPHQMFIPRQDDLAILGVLPSTAFEDFQLMPKEGEIVAVATNPRNPGTLELVYEIETFCWKGRPMINLYAENDMRGLRPDYANPATTHIDGWRIDTPFGSRAFGPDALRLYPQQRLLATLMLDTETAHALSTGGGFISLNSFTASGVFLSGTINAPNGDAAISVSFKDCI